MPNPVNIEDIRDAIISGSYEFSFHSNREMREDQLIAGEIFSSVLRGEVIEDYPDDKPFPSCLIYGNTPRGDPVHSVWGYNAGERYAVLITVYRPYPGRWVDLRVRM